MSEHQFEHVEAALEHAGVRPRPPQNAEAAVFADLSGYTQLTEESGDEVAAEISRTLAQLVNEIAARHRGERREDALLKARRNDQEGRHVDVVDAGPSVQGDRIGELEPQRPAA